MGTGRKKGPGGGGASLNFKVKDYATEELLMAATGKDNEIGIITSTPLTGWHFAAEQPEMQAGEVWISAGTASQVAFNALKKGGTVMVYPLSAKQMQGSTLVDVTAKSWQNGEWVDWVNWLYREGYGLESNFIMGSGSAPIPAGSGIVCNGMDFVRTVEMFDFDANKSKKIIAKVYMGSLVTAYNYPLNLVVTDGTTGNYYQSSSASGTPTSAIAYSQRIPTLNADNTIELNVEAVTGKHYIGLALGYHNGTIVREMYWE